jgi:hypothetical protein
MAFAYPRDGLHGDKKGLSMKPVLDAPGSGKANEAPPQTDEPCYNRRRP